MFSITYAASSYIVQCKRVRFELCFVLWLYLIPTIFHVLEPCYFFDSKFQANAERINKRSVFDGFHKTFKSRKEIAFSGPYTQVPKIVCWKRRYLTDNFVQTEKPCCANAQVEYTLGTSAGRGDDGSLIPNNKRNYDCVVWQHSVHCKWFRTQQA